MNNDSENNNDLSNISNNSIVLNVFCFEG